MFCIWNYIELLENLMSEEFVTCKKLYKFYLKRLRYILLYQRQLLTYMSINSVYVYESVNNLFSKMICRNVPLLHMAKFVKK